jgi:hypothetical protein
MVPLPTHPIVWEVDGTTHPLILEVDGARWFEGTQALLPDGTTHPLIREVDGARWFELCSRPRFSEQQPEKSLPTQKKTHVPENEGRPVHAFSSELLEGISFAKIGFADGGLPRIHSSTLLYYKSELSSPMNTSKM